MIHLFARVLRRHFFSCQEFQSQPILPPSALQKPRKRIVPFAIAAMTIALVACVSAHAQTYHGGANTRAVLDQRIDEARLITLQGNTHPSAIPANDRGAVSDSMPMEHMQLVLQRPAELEQALEKLMEEQQLKGSANYHKWLTAKQFASRFGVAPRDIELVSNWLQSHGFRIDSVLPSGMAIEFSGNAGQVKQAFHTEIHNLEVDGEPHFANMSEPQIPAALSGAVIGVHALHNFKPHSLMRKATPLFTLTGSEGGTLYAVAPSDLATIYNLNPAFSSGTTPATRNAGNGQTVVVIEDTLLANTSDVSTFRTAFGLSGYAGTFSQFTATGSTTCNNSGVNGDEGEAALDAEWAGASAPDAAIELASCADTSTVFGGLIALQNLVNGATPPPVVSISYGECEASNGATANASYLLTYQQAAAEGVSVFVASGDEGAASCDANRTAATHGIAVSGFTSTPYNVSVGGTDFADTYESLAGSPTVPVSTYWNTSNDTNFGSAISYIPEIPWNDSCASELIYSEMGFSQSYGAAGFCNSSTGKSYRSTASGSGGPSVYETGAKPAWQSVLGNPTDNTRDIPDISLFAANGVWNHFLVYCMSDTNEGGATCDYTNLNDTLTLAAGGTSFSSPVMAGIQALIDQQQGAAQGNPNPVYYTLANYEFGASGSTTCNSSLGTGEASNCIFNDVTLGDIDVNCTGSTAASDCYGYVAGNTATRKHGALSSTGTSSLAIAYGTQSGWDFATGLGSINAYNLIQSYGGLATTTVVSSQTNPANFGDSVTFTATVSQPFGNPVVGTITWSANTGCAQSTLSSSTATCITTSLPAGSGPVTATFTNTASGALFLGSNGSFNQTINQAVPAVNWATPAAITYGTPLSGTQLSASSPVAGSFSYNFVPGTVLAAGTYTLTATFTPADTTDYSTASANVQLTVNAASLTVTASSPAVVYGSAVPAITPSYGAFQNGDTPASLTTAPLCTTVYTSASKVGSFPPTNCSGAADSNYTISYVPGAVTITQATPTLTWATPAAIPYGTALSAAQLSATSPVAGTFLYTPLAGTVLPAGSQSLSVSFIPTDSTDYTTATANVPLTVNQALLYVTAYGQSKIYGAALPNLTYAFSGFVNGDNPATATTGVPSLSTTATVTSPVGPYPITVTAGTLTATGNYILVFKTGTLTVNPAPLYVTAYGQSKVYGAALPNLSYAFAGFLNGDNAATATSGVPSLSSAGTASSPVGTYPITVTAGSLTASSNYRLVFKTGTLTVTPALLYVTAYGQNKQYGAALPNLTYAFSGFVNGDTASAATTGTPSLSTTATVSSPVGTTYPITVAAGSLAASNYTLVLKPGTLTVTPALLYVTAYNQSKAYGAALPTLTYAFSGFVNGDNPASATSGAPILSTAATASSPFGSTYPITVAAGSLTATSNYSLVFKPGTLTVTSAPLYVTAYAKTKVYGAPLPTLTYAFAGFVNGDTPATATTGAPILSTSATVSSPVGPYPITVAPGTLTAASYYTLVFKTGTLTVTPAVLTVTANNATAVFNQPLPALTYGVTGFVNGDSVSVLSNAPNETTTATVGSDVGPYPITITAGALSAANYSFQFVNGTLTITSGDSPASAISTQAPGNISPAQPVRTVPAAKGNSTR